MAEALAFAVDGKVKADIELQRLPDINRVFARLRSGAGPSRAVLDFSMRQAQQSSPGRFSDAWRRRNRLASPGLPGLPFS